MNKHFNSCTLIQCGHLNNEVQCLNFLSYFIKPLDHAKYSVYQYKMCGIILPITRHCIY